MNNQIQKFARNTIKLGLARLPESHHKLFKQMYSHKNLDAEINAVVDAMPEDKLDWAMQQVQRSIDSYYSPPKCNFKGKCHERSNLKI